MGSAPGPLHSRHGEMGREQPRGPGRESDLDTGSQRCSSLPLREHGGTLAGSSIRMSPPTHVPLGGSRGEPPPVLCCQLGAASDYAGRAAPWCPNHSTPGWSPRWANPGPFCLKPSLTQPEPLYQRGQTGSSPWGISITDRWKIKTPAAPFGQQRLLREPKRTSAGGGRRIWALSSGRPPGALPWMGTWSPKPLCNLCQGTPELHRASPARPLARRP